LGPLLIGISLTITSYLVTVSLGIASNVPGAGAVVLAVVPVVLTAIAFTLMYLIVPNRRVRVVDAAIGGVAAAVLFEVMKRAFALYVANFPNYKLIYGAFAAVPIFLVWVYLSWVVTLLGAVIAARVPDYGVTGTRVGNDLDTRLRASLAILRVLVRAQHDARALSTRRVLVRPACPRRSASRSSTGWRPGGGRYASWVSGGRWRAIPTSSGSPTFTGEWLWTRSADRQARPTARSTRSWSGQRPAPRGARRAAKDARGRVDC